MSNESSKLSDVYFDDMTITQTLSPIISAEDYPFGLTFNQQTREGTQGQRYGFQGQEDQKDLDLGWVQFKWRMHNPSIGRFFNVDPLASDYVYNSPYAFSENKVVAHIELEGLESVSVQPKILNGMKQLELQVKSVQNRIGNAMTTANNFLMGIATEGDGSGALEGGMSQTKKGGGASPVKSGSKNALEPSMNEMDILLDAMSGAGAGKFDGKTDLSVAEAFSKGANIVEVTSGDDKSDSKNDNTKSGNTSSTSESQSSNTKTGVDTLTYEGSYGKGKYVVKNGTDTIKHKKSGSAFFYDFEDKTGN